MNKPIGHIALACLLVGGCAAGTPAPPVQRRSIGTDPLPVQQVRAYPEAATGLFVCLADFEDSPGSPPGHQQVNRFGIVAAGDGNAAAKADRKFVVNITRTGAGAMEVTLPVGAELVFTLPYPRDFSEYTLLSMALYLEVIRDDLEVTLVSPSGSWRCHGALLQSGWNAVSLDIRELSAAASFDAKSVTEIHIAFAHAGAPVTLNLDDILLIDNRRELDSSPPGVRVSVAGLDYTVLLPLWDRKFTLSRCQDGLWRLATDQAVVSLAAPSQEPADGEHVELMGGKRLGQVEVLECNPVRVRLATTWFFPTRSGEWVSLTVPQIRWEHTFYGDGRWTTHLVVDDGGRVEIGALNVAPPPQAVWSSGAAGQMAVRPFPAPAGRWSYLMAPPGPQSQAMQQAYVKPPEVMPMLVDTSPRASGDTGGDGFDQSQGCYVLTARSGNCRFGVRPQSGGMVGLAFRVRGEWTGPTAVTCAGATVRDVVSLSDGSILFILPGEVSAGAWVEVVGPMSALTVGPVDGQ